MSASFAGKMANEDVSKEVRKKLACQTLDVHDRYTHLDVEFLRKQMKSFPRLLTSKRRVTESEKEAFHRGTEIHE